MAGLAVLGFDLGGGSGRALVLDVDSGQATVESCSWPSLAGPELDLEAWFARLCSAAREALGRAGQPRILGIAAAGMRFGTVALDADGGVILAAANRDARAIGEAMAAAGSAGERLQATTGHWPAPILGAARLRWLGEQRPEAAGRVAHVLALDDWLAWRLCGEVATERSQAAGTGVYDASVDAFSPEAAAHWRISLDPMPRVANAGERLGSLTSQAAESLGLEAGIPLAVGGGDSQLAAVGVGALEAGSTAAICGTTMPIQRVLAEPVGDPSGRVWLEPHALRARWVIESNAGPTGESLDWLGRVLHPQAPIPAARLLAGAGRAAQGAAGLVSHFGAQLMNARTLALPVGELTLSHMLVPGENAGDATARAFVEGLAYAVRANLQQIAELAGPPRGGLHIAGGMARSAVWARILADVTDLEVRVPEQPEATALGAALAAGVGAGQWSDLAEAVGAVVRTRVVEPEAGAVDRYEAGFARWNELRAAREPAAAVAQGHAIQALISGAGGAGATAGTARPRILVTADLGDSALARLRELGEVEYASYRDVGRLLSGATLVEALQGFQIFVTEIDLVDGTSLTLLPELRAIGVCRGAAVNVDAVACARVGIPVMHTPGRNADAVADLALAFLLSLARKLPEATAFLRDPAIEAGDMGAMGRAFGTLRGRELWGKTVGLIGLGAVGRKVAQRLRPFGARVLVHDPFLDADAVALAGAEPADLDTLLGASDFVSLHAAVTDASRGLIGSEAIARMKDGASLVNTARAALVDEAALAEALASGKLAGAALDVFSVEPPGADHPLLRAPNVIATPHMGGNTIEVGAHQGEIIASEIERLLRGERPQHVIEPEALAHFALGGERPAPDAETVAFLKDRPAPAVTDLQRDQKKKPTEPAPPVETAFAAPTLSEESCASVRRVLEAFVSDFASDAAMQRAADGRDVTLRFTLTDAALALSLRLRDGAAAASLEPPDAEPEVELRMTAQVLDGMLGGSLNAMQAATTGDISFAGDAGKAMTIQELQADLERVYTASRERVGPPDFRDGAATPG